MRKKTFVGSPKELLEKVESEEQKNVRTIEFLRLHKAKVIGVLIEIRNGQREYLETRVFRTEREGREFVAAHNKECRKKDTCVQRIPKPETFVIEGQVFHRDGGDPNFQMPGESPLAVSSRVKEIEDWGGVWKGSQRTRFQEEVLEWTLAACPEQAVEEEEEQERKE